MDVGSGLLGQDGWSNAIPPFLNPGAAKIVNDEASTGSRSLSVLGSHLVSSGGITTPYDAVGSYRRPVSFNAAANGYPIVRLSADVRLDGSRFTSGDFAAASLAARSDIAAVGEIELSSDGRVYAYDGISGGPLFTSDTVDMSKWHNLAMEVDFQNNITRFFVNGGLLGQFSYNSSNTSDVLLRGALVAYARPDNADFQRSDFTYRYDNFTISASPVPEPGSISIFLGLAATVAVKRIRRRPKQD
ncbi:MAG: hypothetical protein JNL58_02720 [Planctomyces sp.]|nr:hypothetical protein [Planctomyces sp.]